MIAAQTADREFKNSEEFKKWTGWGVTTYRQYLKIKETFDD